MSYFVGAYAASPSLHNPWNAEVESAYMAGLRGMEAIGGLEVAFYEDLHLRDPHWFLHQLKSDWRYLLTSIPGTMDRLAKDPDFGLASRSAPGRQAAWQFAEKMRLAVVRMHQHFGENVVKAVIIHSAPRLFSRPTSLHRERFTESLFELASWDWQGADLWVEHCDVAGTAQPPAKGFLSLADEIAAIDAIGRLKTPLGILINWGRSALEHRNPDAPLAHIETAHRQGLLRGLIFSGCAKDDAIYGDWADSHAPFAPTSAISGLATSLMTQDRATQCLKAVGDDTAVVRGFKIQALPGTLSVQERLDLVARSLSLLAAASKDAIHQ